MNAETVETRIIAAEKTRFARNEQEDIVMRTAGGENVRIGAMAMAFPLSRPGRMIVLRDADGRELGILDDMRKLDDRSHGIVREEIDKMYFMPRILDIEDYREELGVLTVRAMTDRGERTFQVRHVRKNLRRLGGTRLMIRDVDGNRYEIRDWTKLPSPVASDLQGYL